MTKSETVKQLAAASNEARLASLNQQIERLREAKLASAEELATLLEPLAQAMAALTDETRVSLEQIEQHGKEQSKQFLMQLETAIKTWHSATKAAQLAAERLEAAGQRMEISHYLLAVMTGMVTGLLVSAFLLWRAPAPIMQNVLDAKEVAELLRPEIAMQKPRKGK
ncbi:IncQ-type mobilization protein MobB [Duganella flavida]|uniref:IncQ-type mobilization protein MobB n=1 Tax=Duganella flavida TaxID=2692175 RepID=UPI001E352217|nr:IncQ-type mobilization protein MobB [Duganella flavida]